MKKLIYRVLFALLIFMLLTFFGVQSSGSLMQTLYTVIGIMFSIAISLNISVPTREVRNADIRKRLLGERSEARNGLVLDFVLSTFVFVIALPLSGLSYHVLAFDLYISNVCVAVLLVSIGHGVLNFIAAERLKDEIEKALIEQDKLPK